MKTARAGLQAVLDILKENVEKRANDSDEVMEKRLMREILLWNNVRVRAYLTSLEKELKNCMAKCDTTDQGTTQQIQLGFIYEPYQY
jgi:ribosome biogenesis GTPase A